MSTATQKKEAVQAAQPDLRAAEQHRRDNLKIYNSEPKVRYSVSPLYEVYLGKVHQLSINGITIAFPIDGTAHEIPESFASALAEKVAGIDAKLQKGKKMSDVANNHESYAGQIGLF